MTIEVIRPGLLTSVQDLGRFGMQHFGVPVSGAMDGYALRVANRLAGNEYNAAALEVTLAGPVLEFLDDTLVALTGGDLEAAIDGKPLPMHRPVWVARGRRLSFGRCITGCRAYLAFGGGIDVAPVLGSRSTYVRAALGGLNGRALVAGDRIIVAGNTRAGSARASCSKLRDLPAFSRDGFAAPRWSVQVRTERLLLRPQRIRFVAGRHWEYLKAGVRAAFTSENFQVSASSDRMGYRLEGVRLESGERGEIHSKQWRSVQSNCRRMGIPSC